MVNALFLSYMILPLKPDRIMIYYDSGDEHWLVLRVVAFHYTIFKTDILDILEIIGQEIPAWLSHVIGMAQRAESRPIPEAPFPQSLPSLETIRNLVPTTVEPGMSYPVWSGTQQGGLVVNPGGSVLMQEMPYKAKLRTGSFLGLNFWLQSGMLNGAACLVSQARLCYQRTSETPAQYPLYPIDGYVKGRDMIGASIWHVPGLIDTDSHATEAGWAHNELIYNNGHYYINRNYYLDCPVPEYPNGHFMRPMPGALMSITCEQGVLGRQRLLLQDNYTDGDNLDLVPFGCQPGWPNNEFLTQYGLYNNDDININSLSDIVCLPTPGYVWSHANTTTDGFGLVVWQEETIEGIVPVGSLPAYLSPLMLLSKVFIRCLKLTRQDDFVNRRVSLNGDELSIAGNFLEV
jgi:hypothetical protein